VAIDESEKQIVTPEALSLVAENPKQLAGPSFKTCAAPVQLFMLYIIFKLLVLEVISGFLA